MELEVQPTDLTELITAFFKILNVELYFSSLIGLGLGPIRTRKRWIHSAHEQQG